MCPGQAFKNYSALEIGRDNTPKISAVNWIQLFLLRFWFGFLSLFWFGYC
jgi:hypothetical protein